MAKEPKSAYEITLEKLKQQDRERGEKPPATLNERQKKAIAEIRAKYDARLAEREILFKAEREKAIVDPDALEKIEEEYVRERRHVEGQRDREIATVRTGRKTGKNS